MDIRLDGRPARLVFAAALIAVLSLPGLAQYREYNISGKVVDSQKNPLAGVEISLRELATSRSLTFKTKADGSFKYVGLPHGVYQVVFRKKGFAEKADEWKFETPQDKMLKVEIPPVVLVSAEVIAEAEKMQQAAAEVKAAAEKVRTGDYDGALAMLQPIVDRNPNDSNALYMLGMARQRKGQWAEALPAFLKVTELTPKFAVAFYQAGVCYQRLGQPEKALEQYQKSFDLEPSNADLVYNMGLIEFELGRIDAALARFEQALVLKPDDPAFLEMAGRCYTNKGDFPKAIAFMEKAKAVATDPDRIKFLDDLIAKLKEQIKK